MTHVDERVEAGEGWLPSEAPLLGELSLSPWLPQGCSGASSLNSCPDMIRSISSSVIYHTHTHTRAHAESHTVWSQVSA